MRTWIGTVLVSVIAVACATAGEDTFDTDRQGLAEVRIDAAPLRAGFITRVTVDAAGQTQELAINPATATFDGTLILPSGPQSLVAHAFSGDMLVGQSPPTPVAVQAGVVTRILIRILDVTSDPPPLFGPILDSLSFPTSTQAGTPATFAISVAAPAGDPITYSWSSNCSDATFSAPDAATTTWTKAAAGACTVGVVATSNGISLGQSFGIVVFPAGANSGAVDASSQFITAPVINFALFDLGCFVSNGGGNASCSTAIASPTTSRFDATVVNWGGSTPGTIELSDNCGGRFGATIINPGDTQGDWLPPVSAGICRLTAHAVSGDGLSATATAAVLVRAGTPATSRPPQIFAQYDFGCVLSDAASPADCGVVVPRPLSVFGNIDWADGHPGSLTVTDDCAGPLPSFGSALFFGRTWPLPAAHDGGCLTTVRATSLEGATTAVAARYRLTP